MKLSSSKWQLIATLFFLVLILLGARLLNSPDVAEQVVAWGPWAPIGIIVLKISTIIIAPLGGNPIYLAAPKLFGLKSAIVYLCIGDIIGYLGAFWLGRRYGHRILKKLLSPEQITRTRTLLTRIGTWKKFFVARIALAPLSDILSYAAGLTKLPWWQYAAITVVDVVAYVMLVTTIGYALVTNALTFLLVIVFVTAAPAVIMGLFRKSGQQPSKQPVKPK